MSTTFPFGPVIPGRPGARTPDLAGALNEYSNVYWGWGPEDQELGRRCKLVLGGFDSRYGAYPSLPHPNCGFIAPDVHARERSEENNRAFERRNVRLADLIPEDGLSNLEFRTLKSKPLRMQAGPFPMPSITWLISASQRLDILATVVPLSCPAPLALRYVRSCFVDPVDHIRQG